MKKETKKKADAGLEPNGVEKARKAVADIEAATILRDAVVPPAVKTEEELEREALIDEFRGSNENLEMALGALLEIEKEMEPLQEQLKDLNQQYEIAAEGILGMMRDQGVTFFRAHGKRVGVLLKDRIRVNKEFREDQFAWLRKMGAGDLIVDSVSDGTFSRFVKDEFIEPGKEAMLPDFVLIYKEEKLSIVKMTAAQIAAAEKIKGNKEA